jgi:hypothetical protein
VFINLELYRHFLSRTKDPTRLIIGAEKYGTYKNVIGTVTLTTIMLDTYHNLRYISDTTFRELAVLPSSGVWLSYSEDIWLLSSIHNSTLKMEVIRSSKMSVTRLHQKTKQNSY